MQYNCVSKNFSEMKSWMFRSVVVRHPITEYVHVFTRGKKKPCSAYNYSYFALDFVPLKYEIFSRLTGLGTALWIKMIAFGLE